MTDSAFEDPDHRDQERPDPPETPPRPEPAAATFPEPQGLGNEEGGGGAWISLPPSPPPPPPQASDPQKRPRGSRRRIVAAVVAALVLVGAGTGLGVGLSHGFSTPAGAVAQADRTLSVPAIAARVSPAVVDVTTFARNYLGGNGRTVPLGAGTGMILTSSGLVLTNNHVVEGATLVKVAIEGRTGTYTARVVGVSPSADVALLQIEGVSGLPTVTVGESSTVDLGESVVAIGNALGQGGSPTVTSGHVSALGRDITVSTDSGGAEHLQGLIQSDVSISRGDSGGPLVDGTGRVVGMITAAATNGPAQATSSIGYAIPIDDALAIVNQIRAGHASSDIVIGPAAFLGVEVRDLTPQTAGQLGLSVISGALVVAVLPGMSAAQAGIPRYAVITAVNGERISSAQALGPSIHAHEPGQSIRVTWVDTNGSHTATVRLVAGPAV